MADTIRIKRRASGSPGAPSALAASELAFNEVDNTLWYGKGNSSGNATSIVQISTGPQGPAGPQGVNAYTTTTADFVVPAVGSTVTVTLTDASWVVVGQMLWVGTAQDASNAGPLKVTAKTGNQVTLLNPAVSTGGGGLSDAPSDGTSYGRNNAAWVNVAPLASPTFSGTPAAPTAAANTNTTQLATTAYVIGQASSATPVMDGAGAIGTGTTWARADHQHPTDTSRAPVASPTFTGTPAAPTAAVDTNTTQLASTAFVLGQASAAGDGTPAIDGTAARGTSTHWARADHVHPTDTTRAPLASPTFTGTVTLPADPTSGLQATTKQYSDREAKPVVTLTDGATVALDVSTGSVFQLTATASRTISVPTNKPAAGVTQKIVIRHTASGGAWTLALTTGSAGAFAFGTDIPSLTATASGTTDYIGCMYNSIADRWHVVSVTKGF